jgi:hypothetical protein
MKKMQLKLILTLSLFLLFLSLQSFKEINKKEAQLMTLKKVEYCANPENLSTGAEAFIYTHKLINTESKKINTDSLISTEDLMAVVSAEKIFTKY